MGVPKRLTEMQKRFAEYLVFGGPEGPVNKDGSRQGNAISNAVIMVQVNGHLEKVVRMEVQENSTPIIGHKGHSAHRLVLKTVNQQVLNIPPKL